MPDPVTMGPGAAALLGVVQGLTEFLPVSSSGHLVLAERWLGFETSEDILFEALVHVGTLLAVVFHYRRDIAALLHHWFRSGWGCEGGFRHPLWQMTMGLLVGTLITGAIGVGAEDFLKSLFAKPRLVGLMLLVTASFLTATLRAKERPPGHVLIWQAVIIGLAQSVAIAPGISRSGATISAALLLGVARPEAAKFSFLLAIPAILGATLLEVIDIETVSVPTASLIAGFITAAVVGYGALRLLVGFVDRGRLAWFAPYCAVLGLLALTLG